MFKEKHTFNNIAMNLEGQSITKSRLHLILVENTIVPDIKKLHNRLNEQIQELVNETFNRQHSNDEEKRKAKGNKAELERLMR